MEQVIRDVTWQPRASMMLISCFAAIALLLAIVKIYAIISFIVAGRTREIGVRMALGAHGADVFGMVMRQSVPIGGGLLAGVLAAYALARVLSGMLFGVHAGDPVIFSAVGIGVAATALIAALIPPAAPPRWIRLRLCATSKTHSLAPRINSDNIRFAFI